MHRLSGTWLSCPYFVFAIQQIQGPSKTHKTDENKFKTDTRKLFFFFFSCPEDCLSQGQADKGEEGTAGCWESSWTKWHLEKLFL